LGFIKLVDEGGITTVKDFLKADLLKALTLRQSELLKKVRVVI